MRLLFALDKKDYKENGTSYARPSVRGIIIKDKKIAMIHSLKYNYFKLPGGGIEKGESHYEALIREVKEETGLTILPSSIIDYGHVYRIQKGKKEDIFIQDNFYYLCNTYDEIGLQNLDEHEEDEEFILEIVSPRYALNVNITSSHGSKSEDSQFAIMIEREIGVLNILITENYF